MENVARGFVRDYGLRPSSTAPGKSKHRERPSALLPGLRLRSVHGSGGIKTSGTPFGTSSGTADCVLRPRLRGNRNVTERPSALLPGLRLRSVHGSGKIETWRNVLRRFIRDCGLRPSSTARENRNTAERRSAIRPGLRTVSFVHGSGKSKHQERPSVIHPGLRPGGRREIETWRERGMRGGIFRTAGGGRGRAGA
ncbi:MAG: hypothetical protein Q4C96_11375 [Planctomycetia bacterium]|nr:hypothetical protein [Planctomycetia bacterium]